MPEAYKLTRVPSLRTVADFRRHVASLGIELPCEEGIVAGAESPLAQPVAQPTINGKRIGNRWAIQPMEGWDASLTGAPTDEVCRRWQRFGESGAKLIYGGGESAGARRRPAHPPPRSVFSEGKHSAPEPRPAPATP